MPEQLASVIIPAYNVELHIVRTLESVIQQDYANLEIIVVNDASTDSTGEIVQSMLKESGRNFRVIDHAQKRGVSAARNTGLAAAKGKYVWFCDSDDLAAKNFVSRMCTEADTKNAEVVFCGIKNYYEDDGSFSTESLHITEEFLSPNQYLEAWADRKIFFWSVWNFIFRRELLTRNHLRFAEGCILGEDTEFALKALVCAPKVSFVNDELYTYVHHKGQSTDRRKDPEMFRSMMLSRLRLGRAIVRRTKSLKARRYILSMYLPDTIIKYFTVYAESRDKERYIRALRGLRHRKIRGLLLSSVIFIARMPELFFKAVMLLYMPGLYYFFRAL